jgi:hypothetical protein
VNDPLFSKVAPLTIAVEVGVNEIRVEFGKDLGDENRVVRDVAGALSVIASAKGLPPTCTVPVTAGEAVSMMDTVPSVWLAT